jgi:hypothetical protein
MDLSLARKSLSTSLWNVDHARWIPLTNCCFNLGFDGGCLMTVIIVGEAHAFAGACTTVPTPSPWTAGGMRDWMGI